MIQKKYTSIFTKIHFTPIDDIIKRSVAIIHNRVRILAQIRRKVQGLAYTVKNSL